MCLSKVYEKSPNGEKLLFSSVANVLIDPDKVTFIDILGERVEYKGKVYNMDLIDNKILVGK